MTKKREKLKRNDEMKRGQKEYRIIKASKLLQTCTMHVMKAYRWHDTMDTDHCRELTVQKNRTDNWCHKMDVVHTIQSTHRQLITCHNTQLTWQDKCKTEHATHATPKSVFKRTELKQRSLRRTKRWLGSELPVTIFLWSQHFRAGLPGYMLLAARVP